jgi:hypothetical protein
MRVRTCPFAELRSHRTACAATATALTRGEAGADGDAAAAGAGAAVPLPTVMTPRISGCASQM